MPTVEQLAATPKTPRSLIWARANGSSRGLLWLLGRAGYWISQDGRDEHRRPSNLNLIEVLYVAPASEREVAA